jgi:type III pantothenate kinase
VSARLLAITIGNSSITIGVFEQDALAARWRAHTDADKTADEYALLLDDFFAAAGLHPDTLSGAEGWRGAILVSVVPPLRSTFRDLCRKHLRIDPLIVGDGVKTGMPIRYDDPRALGADRLVEAVAAKAKYGAPAIVIDFGTATTFNAVNRAGEFAGGAIAPGLNLAADALYRATAQLPRVDLALPPRVLATNPVHAIQAGIVYGYLAMVEGMVARMRVELGEPDTRVIVTGGRAALLAHESRVIEVVDPDLMLEGLRVIYEMNTGQ